MRMRKMEEIYENSIDFKRLTFSYQKAECVCFSSADFSLGENEKAILVGDKGSGKTTLLYILSGLIDDYIGKLELLGYSGDHIKNAYKNVVFIPENPVLIENKSVLENIQYAYSVLYGNSENLDYVVRQTERLESIKNVKARKLSYYEKVMVECERAKLKDIKLLMIDRTVSDINHSLSHSKIRSSEMDGQIHLVKQELRDLINLSKTAIVVCDDKSDVEFFNAEKFSVIEINLGKIYKHKSLDEYKKDMKHVSGVKLISSLQKMLVRIVEEDGKLSVYLSNTESRLELEKRIIYLNKKRKKEAKRVKINAKTDNSTENNAIGNEVFDKKIDVPFTSKLSKCIFNNDAIIEEYFFIVIDKNQTFEEAMKDESIMLFIESTGERIL